MPATALSLSLSASDPFPSRDFHFNLSLSSFTHSLPLPLFLSLSLLFFSFKLQTSNPRNRNSFLNESSSMLAPLLCLVSLSFWVFEFSFAALDSVSGNVFLSMLKFITFCSTPFCSPSIVSSFCFWGGDNFAI